MNKVIQEEFLAPRLKKIVLSARDIAQKAQPGQFVTVIVDENGERIPLTIVDSDAKKDTITLIIQGVGKSTCKLLKLKAKDEILHVLGPLGKPTEISKIGTVVTVGGGVGIAEVYPVTRAFKEVGNKVIAIIGARNEELLILKDKLAEVTDELLMATDDGSYGHKGFVSDLLLHLLAKEKIDLVYAVGPIPMMRVVSDLTRSLKIKTLVSLNPIMVDATGMCASCRVHVGQEIKFGCVDGPEFDAHLVDFAELQRRLNLFSEQEKTARKC